MHWIRFAIVVFFAMLLQAGPVDVIAITDAQIKPNFLLILLAFCVTQLPPGDAIICAFILGLCTDIIMVVVGPYTLAFGTLGTLVSELRRLIVLRHALGQAVATLAIGVTAALLVIPLSRIKGEPMHPSIGFEPLYSALLAPLFSFILPWFMGMPRRRVSGDPH